MSYGRRRPPDIEGMVSLKVDNLTYRTTPESLKRMFERYGEVGDVYIPRDPYTQESRGFAFVRFYDQRDADDAIDCLDGTMMDGRELRVQLAKHTRPTHNVYRRGGGGPPRSRPRRRSSSRSRSRSRSHRRRRSTRSRSRSRSRHERSRSRSPGRNHRDDHSKAERGGSQSKSNRRKHNEDDERNNGQGSQTPDRPKGGSHSQSRSRSPAD